MKNRKKMKIPILQWRLWNVHSTSSSYDVSLPRNTSSPYITPRKNDIKELFHFICWHLAGKSESVTPIKNAKNALKTCVHFIKNFVMSRSRLALCNTCLEHAQTQNGWKKIFHFFFIQFQNVKLFCMGANGFLPFFPGYRCIVCFVFIKTFRLSQTTR